MPTVFVRFGGCDLRCSWCDSPQTWKPAEKCRIERSPGAGDFEEVANPVAVADAASAIFALEPAAGSFVSLTGGEPLLQPEATEELAARTRRSGLRSYLETHGLAVEALEAVVGEIDVVSMDWKLASDVRPARGAAYPPGDFHDRHEEFLAVAAARTEVFVKLVITPSTLDDEVDEVCRRLEARAPDSVLVLQPVTPTGGIRESPSAEALLALLFRCRARHADVRLIPQTHRAYGAR